MKLCKHGMPIHKHFIDYILFLTLIWLSKSWNIKKIYRKAFYKII